MFQSCCNEVLIDYTYPTDDNQKVCDDLLNKPTFNFRHEKTHLKANHGYLIIWPS